MSAAPRASLHGRTRPISGRSTNRSRLRALERDETRARAITRTGNAHLRRVLVEAAWHYRHHPFVGAALRQRPGRRGIRLGAMTSQEEDAGCRDPSPAVSKPSRASGSGQSAAWPQKLAIRRPRRATTAIASSAPIKAITNNTGKVGTGIGLIVIGLVAVLLPGLESPPPDDHGAVDERAHCVDGDIRRHRDDGVTRRRRERIRTRARPRGDGARPAGAGERGHGQARRRVLRHGDGTACRRAPDVRRREGKGDWLPRHEGAAFCARLRQREVASSCRGTDFDRTYSRVVAGA